MPRTERPGREADQPPCGFEVKDILNLIVFPINIIGTTTYNHTCLDGAGLSVAEQFRTKLLSFNPLAPNDVYISLPHG